MNESRRTTLQVTGAASVYAALVSLGLIKPGTAQAAATRAELFKLKGVPATLKGMDAAGAVLSDKISIIAADIAENGAVVPVKIISDLPNTTMIALLIDKNPNALAGSFDILGDTQAAITLRVKMGKSSDIVALVKADGQFYMARKEVKVTLGGCGG